MAGDVTGSKVLRHREEMGEYFGGGHSYSANKERVARQYTAAANKHMGEAADQATPEVIKSARERMGLIFENAAKVLGIRFDDGLADDFRNITAQLRKEGFPEETTSRIVQQMTNIINGFVDKTPRAVKMSGGKPTVEMSGDTYQILTRAKTPLARAIEDADPNISYYAERIRSALDDALERTVDTAVKTAYSKGKAGGPARANAIRMAEAQEELTEARRQWYAMIIISKSVSGEGTAAAEGLISPQKLRQNLTNSPDNKLSYAAGRSGLQNLARSGVAILTPEKSSGSTERLIAHTPTVTGLATGLVGRAINSNRVQNWLKNTAAPGAAPYINNIPGLPWSIMRGGVDALSSQGSGDALAQ